MRRNLLTVFALVGALSAVLAVLVVWLVLQEPVMVADAVSSGQYRPLLAALTDQVGQWCRVLVRLL